MLAIARAMIEPRRLLLIDEPSKGLAPAIVDTLIAALRELKRTATTVLLVEQNFPMAQALGDGVAVMDDGRVVHRGRMAALAADARLQQRLLGSRSEHTNERRDLPKSPRSPRRRSRIGCSRGCPAGSSRRSRSSALPLIGSTSRPGSR